MGGKAEVEGEGADGGKAKLEGDRRGGREADVEGEGEGGLKMPRMSARVPLGRPNITFPRI